MTYRSRLDREQGRSGDVSLVARLIRDKAAAILKARFIADGLDMSGVHAFALGEMMTDFASLIASSVNAERKSGRIAIPLNGVTSPSWSPDGRQLVFTGYDGGWSDLFIVNRDGSGLRRLTSDRYADLHPAWSPDGKTIAFTTDRGPGTDFTTLRFGNMRVALYHLNSGSIELLNHMDRGKNINPVWAPDGKSLAFVSDRTGISNIFMYDLTDGNIYQLSDVYTRWTTRGRCGGTRIRSRRSRWSSRCSRRPPGTRRRLPRPSSP